MGNTCKPNITIICHLFANTTGCDLYVYEDPTFETNLNRTFLKH